MLLKKLIKDFGNKIGGYTVAICGIGFLYKSLFFGYFHIPIINYLGFNDYLYFGCSLLLKAILISSITSYLTRAMSRLIVKSHRGYYQEYIRAKALWTMIFTCLAGISIYFIPLIAGLFIEDIPLACALSFFLTYYKNFHGYIFRSLKRPGYYKWQINNSIRMFLMLVMLVLLASVATATNPIAYNSIILVSSDTIIKIDTINCLLGENQNYLFYCDKINHKNFVLQKSDFKTIEYSKYKNTVFNNYFILNEKKGLFAN